jgi:methyl-accepting chemotaxis protein
MILKNANISTRLMILTATLLVLLSVVGLMGVRALSGADQGLRSVYEKNTVPLVHLGEALGEVHHARSLVVSGMGAENSEASEQYYKGVKPAHDKVAQLWDAYQASLAGADAQAGQQAEAVKAAWKAYAASGDKVISLAKSGDFEAASTHMRTESAKKFETVRDAILARMKQERENAKSSFESTSAANAATKTGVLITLGLGLLLGAGLSYVIVMSIKAPLKRSVKIAEQVAEGDLCQQIVVDSQDELGQLLSALATMQQRLRDCVGEVRRTADSISTASAEIASGTLDLSQRTEQTASSLQSTSSSMTQFSGTLSQSADSARQANQLASSAAEVAARGGAVVSQVVTTMAEINASSNRITDIIGVIDGIAFQTNILALNAAVEAARAGEQGRGFAVVASEVRSLAGRSAEAAKEIKRLIVASAEKVDGGSRLVADAGQTMNEIVGSVRRVSDIIGEITAASADQSQGIGQMSQSVHQLDRMTQQNAALVEQSAAAAESLKDQAAKLVEVVSIFKLE